MKLSRRAIAFALCAVLLVSVGEAGIRATASGPGDGDLLSFLVSALRGGPFAVGPAREAAPKQRWEAAPAEPLPAENGNTELPPSLRQTYPVRPEPALPTPAQGTAAVVAPPPTQVRGYDPATSVELPDQRTERSREYTNADGTQTTMFSTAPVNYRDADGKWRASDPRLLAADGGWRNAAGPVDIRVAAQADAATLVRFDLGGAEVGYGLAGAAPTAGRASGSTVTYPGVHPATDLELATGHGALKETLVLRGPDAPREFTFPLTLRGLRVMPGTNGTIALLGPDGALRATIPAGHMLDANRVVSRGVRYALGVQDGQTVLRVVLDEEWLADPARAYPVRVDPSVDFYGADSAMISGDGGSMAGGSDLYVGPVFGNMATYLKFGSLVNQLRFHTIYGAQLSIVEFIANTCEPMPMTVHAATQDWSPGPGFTYPGPAVGPALAEEWFHYGFLEEGQSESDCPADQALFDLGQDGRDVVQGWVDGAPNYGLSLRAPEDPEAARVIAGPGTANPPTLYVTHTPFNAEYTIPNPVPQPPVLQNQAGKVKVTVTNRSAEDWAPGNYFLAYRAYNADTDTLVAQIRAANLTATVSRGAQATLEATIQPLPPGVYLLDFTMVHSGGTVFTDEQVPPARMVIEVIDIPPVVQELYPPNGYQAPTLTPQLWARAVDIDAPPGSSLRFAFRICEMVNNAQTNCLDSGDQTKQAWTVPAGRLAWSKTYQWRATVKDGSNVVDSDWSNLLTSVPQPELTSHVAGAPYGTQGREFDPQTGNYSTAAADASVANVGPTLGVLRTYNSLDPRRDLTFGAGWTTQFDMKVVPDDDGSGNVVVTYADGQQVRYGRNPDGTFAAPAGRVATLTLANGSYTLADRGGMSYQFSGNGRLSRIVDGGLRAVVLTYDGVGKLAKATAANSQSSQTGRALTFTWTGAHITSVRTDPVNGSPLVWTYTYNGDLLTKVCGPTNACTTYTYAPGSHARSSVIDSAPQSFWRLGETQGTGAASEILVNLGKDAGTYRNVTLGVAGPPGSGGNKAASFNGSTSMVEVPKGLLKKSRDAAVELWFKVSPTQVGGPLIGYQDAALGANPAPTQGGPVLYVGIDGKLRGQFRGGPITPITTTGTVNNNVWHHVVLSALGSTQTMWLDGVKVGTLTADIDQTTLTFNQIGAAFAPNPSTWPAWGATVQRNFSGSIDEVALYNNPLGAAVVAAHYRYGTVPADQLTKVTLPSGRTVSEVSYNPALDRVKEYVDTNGGIWKLGAPTVFGGDEDLRRSITVLDPAGRPSFYEYDALANRVLRTGSPNGMTTREEDLPGYRPPNPTPRPTPSPSVVCNTPDPGAPKFCTILPGDPSGPPFIRQPLSGMVVRTFGYDDNGFQNRVVNENGVATTFVNDARGNVTAQTTCRTATVCNTSYSTFPANPTNPLDPRNDKPTEVRDGRSTSATDTRYRTTYTYNAMGNLLTQTNPDGGIIRHTYTTGNEASVDGGFVPPGLLATTTDVRNAVTRYAYFANGDLGRLTEPSGQTTSYTYDAIGRRVTEKDVSTAFPTGVITTYGYDAHSRPSSTVEHPTTDPVTGTRHQHSTETDYDDDGNVTTVTEKDLLSTDPARITTYGYDGRGRQNRVTDAEGNVTTYDYDQFGNRVGMVDANGNQYRYAYTARNAISEVRLRDWRGDPPGVPAGTMVDDFLVVESYAYDFAGRKVRHTDAMGHRVEFTYFGDDLLATATLKNFHNPDGSTRDMVLTNNTYDGAGNLTREITGNGTLITDHTYTKAGQKETTTTNPGGLARRTAFTYDLAGEVASVTQSGAPSNVVGPVTAQSSVVGYQYDQLGNLIRETVGTGATTTVTTYGYDQRGLRVSATTPRGNVAGADPLAFTTNYTYDELGQQTAITAPPVSVESNGGAPQTVRPVVRAGYNAFGDAVSSVDESGNVGRTAYDRLGRVVSVTGAAYTPPGSMTSLTPTSSQRYDGLGNVLEAVDPLGNATRFSYDRMNRVTQRDEPASTNNERALWTYTYTRTGDPLSVTDPTGARVETTYDDLDRRATVTAIERRPTAGAFTTQFTYDDGGNLSRTTSPTGAASTMEYDALGQLIRSRDPHNVLVQYGYDFAGRQVRLSDGIGRTDKTEYDTLGRIGAQSDLSPAGVTLRTVGYGYDANGNVVTATDALGKTTTYNYDALDRLTSQVEPVSATKSITTSFGYDAASRRTRYTDGRGNATVYTYNSLRLPQSVIEPSTPTTPNAADRTWTVAYDTAGQAKTLTSPGSVTRQRTYDAAGRLTLETGAGASVATTDKTFGYDLAGRVKSAGAPGGTNTYTYNDRGGMLTAGGPSGTSSFSYDNDGQPLTRTDAAGTTKFTYDKGRLSTVDDALTRTVQKVSYDGAGRVSTVDYGSGRVRTFGVDDFGRTNSDTLRNAANAVVSSVTYTFDVEDRMTRKVTTGTAGAADNTYGYDDAGRLTSWTVGATTTPYGWDDSGNRITNGTKTASYDARNRLISDTDYTYSYTPRGTMAARTSSGFSETFSFDAFDRLINDAGQTFSYDSLDRVAKRGTTAFSYAGTSDEVVSDGTENYARGLGDELLAVAEGTQKRLVVSDAHGDVVGAFDPANTTLNALNESRAYSPFGQKLAETGATQANLGFQGDWTDPQTGEVNMGARWYDPSNATFLSRDSAQYSRGPSILANPYAYGAGDPLDNTDPDGHWPSCGWCKKQLKKASEAVKKVKDKVVKTVKSVAKRVGKVVSTVARAVVSAAKWAANTVANAASWVYQKARTVVSAVVHAVGAGLRWARDRAASALHHVANFARGAASWAGDRVAQARQAAAAVAHRVTQVAQAAVRFAVEHNPLPAIAAALKPVYSAMTEVVSAAAHLPAAVVSEVRDVVHDVSQSVQAVYHAAVEAVGTVVETVSTAVRAVSEFAVAALPMVAGAVAGFVVGTLVTAGCTALTLGIGAAGCAAIGTIAGFAVGGAVTGAMSCPPGKSIAGCAVRGGAAGAVAGVAFVATGGLAGMAGAGAVTAGVVSGAATGAVQTAATQYLETGELDARGIATSAVIGGAMGGLTARGGRSGPGSSCSNSFTEDTRVVMADGTSRSIEDIRVGDMVMATDPTTGRTEARPVTEVIIGKGTKVLVQLTVHESSGHDSTVVATNKHPFHTADYGWQTADHLTPGDRLDTGTGTATVTTVHEWSQTAQVRNLTVDGLHTYYVLIGQTPVLVHNCGTPEDVYAFGNRSNPRPPRLRDLQVSSEDANIGSYSPTHPTDLANGASTTIDPVQSSLSGHYHQLPEGTALPEGLGFHADGADVGGNMPWGHRTIYPTRDMTYSEFSSLFESLPWQYAGKK